MPRITTTVAGTRRPRSAASSRAHGVVSTRSKVNDVMVSTRNRRKPTERAPAVADAQRFREARRRRTWREDERRTAHQRGEEQRRQPGPQCELAQPQPRQQREHQRAGEECAEHGEGPRLPGRHDETGEAEPLRPGIERLESPAATGGLFGLQRALGHPQQLFERALDRRTAGETETGGRHRCRAPSPGHSQAR